MKVLKFKQCGTRLNGKFKSFLSKASEIKQKTHVGFIYTYFNGLTANRIFPWANVTIFVDSHHYTISFIFIRQYKFNNLSR